MEVQRPLLLIVSDRTPDCLADITNPARQDAAETLMATPSVFEIFMPAVARKNSALLIMKPRSIGRPLEDLKAAFFPKTSMADAAARCLYFVRSKTGSKEKSELVLIAMAGIDSRSLRVFGDGTAIYTYELSGVERIDTAPPVRTGLSDFGWTKNSPPRRHAKNAMQEAVAQVRSLNDSRLRFGHPVMHAHICSSMSRDSGIF